MRRKASSVIFFFNMKIEKKPMLTFCACSVILLWRQAITYALDAILIYCVIVRAMLEYHNGHEALDGKSCAKVIDALSKKHTDKIPSNVRSVEENCEVCAK